MTGAAATEFDMDAYVKQVTAEYTRDLTKAVDALLPHLRAFQSAQHEAKKPLEDALRHKAEGTDPRMWDAEDGILGRSFRVKPMLDLKDSGALARGGVSTWTQLLDTSREDLLKIEGIGPVSVERIAEVVEKERAKRRSTDEKKAEVAA